MAAVWARALSELRRRWRAAAALAVLVGIAGGVVLFGVAGSRRTFSALDRFVAYTHPVDAFVYGEDLDLAAVEALPQVVDADSGTYFLMAPGTPSGEPDPSLGINPFSSSQGRLLTSIDRPMVVSGYLPDPDQTLEVAVNEELAEARGLAPGDSLVMWGYAAEQFYELLEAPGTVQPEGPRVELTVTAVVRHPRDVTPYASDDEVVYLSKQNLFLTPAFHHRYVNEVANFDQAVGASLGVRLARGHADLAAFTQSVRSLPGGESAEVDPDTSSYQALAAGQRAIELQAMALLGFAALLAMAAVAVVGQSLARQVQLETVEHPALRALGMSRGQLIAVLVVQALVVGLVGAALAVAVAVGLSPLAPIGVARGAEVDPGVSIDLPVLSLGALSVLAAVLARAALPARRASRLAGSSSTGAPTGFRKRPSPISERVAALGAPPSTAAGVRMALEPGREGAGVPLHTALAGAAAAVLAVAAALAFAASLDRLVGTPALQGWGWDVIVGDGNVDNLDKGRQLLPASPFVDGFTAVSQPATLTVGSAEIGVTGLLALEGDAGPDVLDGRLPERAGEIALGPETLDRLGVAVGDQLDVSVNETGARSRLEVVGTALLGHTAMNYEVGLGHGSVVTFDTMRTLLGQVQAATFLVDYAPGVDPDHAFAALQADWGNTVLRWVPPDQVENLRQVGGLPVVFAGVVVVLAVCTLGHTLVSSVRLRRSDLAVLKALGFSRRQVRATVAWQATTLAALALLAGLPLGVAAGRWAWRLVAEGIGTPAEAVTPIVAVLATVPVALATANLLAALPARAAARVRPAVVLRSE